MKLKNEALQKLYDKLASDTLVFGISEKSPVDKAFKECDDELSDSITFAQIKDLQDRCDIFEKSNGTLLGANLDLATKKRQLEKDLADAKKQMGYFTTSRDNWRSRAKHAEDEVMRTTETLEKVNADRNELQRHIDILSASEREALSANKKLEKDLHDAKTQLTELGKAYDELSADNKKLKARLDCLRGEAKFYRNHYKEQCDKIQELKSRLNSMCNVKYGEYVRSRDIGYENGQINLWNMLQNVNDAKPFELATCFPDVSCMDDILSWDLEDFLDAYKSWQETKEHERIIRDACDAFYYGFKAGLASEVPVDRN